MSLARQRMPEDKGLSGAVWEEVRRRRTRGNYNEARFLLKPTNNLDSDMLRSAIPHLRAFARPTAVARPWVRTVVSESNLSPASPPPPHLLSALSRC